jgi:D-glycero-D-manno-heptose 1,7-bisphosphate phosphatase
MCALVEQAGGQIDVICYCPHAPDAGCSCRKPLTGLLEQIADALDQPVQGAWLVGDHLKDMQMAIAGGCKPVMVLTGKGSQQLATLPAALHSLVQVVDDLAEAARHVLRSDTAA